MRNENFTAVAVRFFLLVVSANAQVPDERLSAAEREPHNWLTYSGDYNAQRFSPLNQLTPENVARLKVAWVYQMQGRGRLQVSPLVADGVMYLTEPPARVPSRPRA